jgi:hypothetical protein
VNFMPQQSPAKRVLELERETLCALCIRASANARRETVMRELSNHVWQDAEHRVVFEAIQRLSSSDPKLLREQLPAQTTRMGFPDVNWENYFTPAREADGDFDAIVRELLAAPKDTK